MSTEASRIERRLQAARSRIDRVPADRLALEVAAGALVIDIRPTSNRETEGELPGSIVVERIHLEWRLDATSGSALPDASDDRRVILVCNEGHASSLAAADLRELGLCRVTDLEGGYRAWRDLTDATQPAQLTSEPRPEG